MTIRQYLMYIERPQTGGDSCTWVDQMPDNRLEALTVALQVRPRDLLSLQFSLR